MDDKLKRGLALHCGSGIVGSHASTEVPMPRMELLGDLFDEDLDDMHLNGLVEGKIYRKPSIFP